MKEYNIKRYLSTALLGVVLLGASSCKLMTDPEFEHETTVRISEQAEALRKQLVSSENGWILTLRTSTDDKYGAYNVGLRFSDKGEVQMNTETMADASQVYKSLYEVGDDNGVSLNFNTYNEALHAYSTPDRSLAGGISLGYEADYNFTLYRIVSPDTIELYGKKRATITRLVRASEPIEQIMVRRALMRKTIFTQADMDLRREDALVGTINGKNVLIKLAKDNMNVYLVTFEGETRPVSLPYTVTDTGIRLYTSQKADFIDFTWNSAERALEAANGDRLIARKDPYYDKYAAYLGEYTLRLDNSTTYDVTLVEDGYLRYRVKGLQFEFVMTYNTDRDRFELAPQKVKDLSDGGSVMLAVWAPKSGGSLTWGQDYFMYGSYIKNSSPAEYVFRKGSANYDKDYDSFILWKLKASGQHNGEASDQFNPTRFASPKLIRKN